MKGKTDRKIGRKERKKRKEGHLKYIDFSALLATKISSSTLGTEILKV